MVSRRDVISGSRPPISENVVVISTGEMISDAIVPVGGWYFIINERRVAYVRIHLSLRP